MGHRFNCYTNKKEPKPSASERTWSRYRVIHNMETPQDELRLSRLEESKSKIKEWKEKMKAKLVKKHG